MNHLRLLPESARVVCWLQLFSVLQSTGFYPAVQVSWAPQSAPPNSRTKIMLMMPCYFLTALLSGRTSCQALMKLHIRWVWNSEYLLVENQDPELRSWGNTSSSAITRSRCRVHRPLHISWQWYPLVWAFHPRDTHAYRSSFKYFRRLANIWKRTGLSLQMKIRLCPCHLHTVICLRDMDSPEGWWTVIRSIPHELPTMDLGNPLVPFCHERLSH